jgi:hypothetical protein
MHCEAEDPSSFVLSLTCFTPPHHYNPLTPRCLLPPPPPLAALRSSTPRSSPSNVRSSPPAAHLRSSSASHLFVRSRTLPTMLLTSLGPRSLSIPSLGLTSSLKTLHSKRSSRIVKGISHCCRSRTRRSRLCSASTVATRTGLGCSPRRCSK